MNAKEWVDAHPEVVERVATNIQWHLDWDTLDSDDYALAVVTLIATDIPSLLSEPISDLEAKITYLLNMYQHWSEEGTFTFPDGDTWHRETT